MTPTLTLTLEWVRVNGRLQEVLVRRSPSETSLYLEGAWVTLASHPLGALRSLVLDIRRDPPPDPYPGAPSG